MTGLNEARGDGRCGGQVLVPSCHTACILCILCILNSLYSLYCLCIVSEFSLYSLCILLSILCEFVKGIPLKEPEQNTRLLGGVRVSRGVFPSPLPSSKQGSNSEVTAK